MNITVFWDVVLCSVVKVYRRVKGVYCFHHQDKAVSTSETSVNLVRFQVFSAANMEMTDYYDDGGITHI
jgi:hypothetical protein